MKFLITMRADLLELCSRVRAPAGVCKSMKGDTRDPQVSASLRQFDYYLQSKFMDYFKVGFLTLQRITWDSPTSLLEKLMRYEAVHHISSFSAMKQARYALNRPFRYSMLTDPQRLGYGRRCFAFFHPSMESEPLVFVQVSLEKSVPGSIQRILGQNTLWRPVTLPPETGAVGALDTAAEELLRGRDPAQAPRLPEVEGHREEEEICDEDQATTAVFYSISSTQKGLRGVGH